MRLFLAVFPPERVQYAVWAATQPLRGAGAASWTRPDNLHYTLRFLGELGEDGARRAGEAARAAVRGHARFEMALGGLGAFPNARRARVLWLGATAGAEALQSLARALDHELHEQGFGREERPFAPHLTLGRPRGDAHDWTSLLVRPSGEIARFEVDELVLVHSQLSPRGSTYTALVQAPLDPPESTS